jgi:hypothetical protein
VEGLGCRWCAALEVGRGQRLGQARAPWRAASARRLIELGRAQRGERGVAGVTGLGAGVLIMEGHE